MSDRAGVVARFLRSTFHGGFHVSQEPPGWVSALAGWATSTGLNVSPDRALELTDVYACVRVLAESVAMLPLVMYRRQGPESKERAPDHYLYSLLHDAPNPEMSSFTFRETLMGHLGTWGNGYAEIEFNRAGGINALWPLRPDKMKVEREWRDDGARQRPGELVYRYTLPQKFGSRQVKLPAERVFHLKGLAFDGLVGYSPIGLQRQAVGLGLAAEEYAARFFANDARPGGVLQHPGKLGEEAFQRLRKSWKEQHQGLSKAHRLAILEEGMEYQEIGLPPADAQFVETSKLSTVKVARMYRVPLHLIQEQEKQTSWGTGIEQMNIGFVVYTLLPWLTRWEQEIALNLLTQAERERFFVEHLVDGLLRGEIGKRYEAYATGRQWGWLSANDVRRLENMNPVDGGDEYLVPLNMVPAGEGAVLDASLEDEERAARRALLARDYARSQGAVDDGRQTTDDDDGENGRRAGIGGSAAGFSRLEERAARSARGRHRLAMAHLRLYEDVAARVLRREVNDVGNAAGRLLPRRDTAEFSLWLQDFYREHQGFVSEQFAPLAMSYGEMVTAQARNEVGEPEELTPELEDWIRNYLDTFAARHASVSEGRIRGAMREAIEAGEDPLEAVEGELEDWPEARAQETARWESVRFNNALAVAIYIGARRTQLRWVAFGESCPYCTDLNGQVVGIREFFLPAGTDYEPEGAERPLHVGHNVGHAPAHDGCLPGNSLVLPGGRITASSERWYDGDLVIIRSASGYELSCTPNHPVLTDSGWVKAGLLNVGDHVICDRSIDWIEPAMTVVGDNKNVPACIKDVAKTVGRAREVLSVPVPTAAKDFDGDGAHSKVAVIRSNGELLPEAGAALSQEFSKRRLSLRNPDSATLPRSRGTTKGLKAVGVSSAGSMGRCDLGCSLFISPLFPDETLGFRPTTGLDAVLDQATADNWARDTQLLGQGVFRLTGSVFVDDIVNVERQAFCGHVYNLQTTNGFYVAGGVIVHNCDCMTVSA